MNLDVCVVAPTGRDGELIKRVLAQGRIEALICDGASLLTSRARGPLGPLLIAEEALTSSFIEQLREILRDQPPWSDIPILILTAAGQGSFQQNVSEFERLGLGAPVLLERPIRTMTLLSSVRAAMRARQRQYEIRDTLGELKEGREKLQAVLDHLPVGVILAKANGEIALANHSAERILRHPVVPALEPQADGQWITFHPDDRRVRADEYPLNRAMVTGRPVPPEEYRYRRDDGSLGWISLTASPIFGDNNAIAGGVMAITDIDHQKHAELALIQSEKLAVVGRLAASISHEINNPLESVTNLIYLASQNTSNGNEIQAWLDMADKELQRVSQIVNQTLRFHRQATNPRAITTQELLEPTLGLYQGRLTNAGIHLDLQHRGTSSIICYEGDIRQVLNNLVGNAIDAMKNGGRLIIRTSHAVHRKSGHNGVRITIADTGVGMSDSVVSHIFDAFYTTKGLSGTGLGLWISKGIIDKHRGSIRVRSRTGSRAGTVFSIFLPMAPSINESVAP